MNFHEGFERAHQPELPHSVLLVATVARLLDLHSSKRKRGSRFTNVPRPPENGPDAGFYLTVGLHIIAALHQHALKGSSGPVPIAKLHEEIASRVGDLTRQDLEFCVACLSTEREVCYLDERSLPLEESRSAQSPTKLLRFDRRFGQVAMTDAGRLLMRIGALHQDWIYEDKDVERIPAAIERGIFEDIPRVCEEVIGNLRSLNERLTEIEESPTFESLRTEFQQRGRQYREMLQMAGEALARSLTALGSAGTRDRFERWRAFRGIDDLEIEDVLGYVEAVHQSLHSLERHFVEFLRNIQSRRRAPLGVIRFQEVAQRLVYAAPAHEALRNLLGDLGPWRVRVSSFHPMDFTGRADLFADARPGKQTVFDEVPAESAHGRFQSFLERNRDWLFERLRQGPVAFSELVQSAGLTIESDESPANFFGVFMLPEEVGGEGMAVHVGLSGKQMSVALGSLVLTGDDPVIWLEGVSL
jgi:hypothetical protein